MSSDGPGTREVAHRLFAAEFDDASLSYSESDEERAPNYVVTPTGARVNRLFVAGVLTEVERINEDTRRGRVVDPSGAFVTYAGQYQPDEQAFLERANPPAFVALTGKARTFEPEDSDRVFTSVRPESINAVDADTRDRWTVSAAEATLDRLAVFAQALDSDLRGDDLRAALAEGGAPEALAAGIPRALDHYRTSPAYVEAIRQLAEDALETVAGERDDVRAPEFAPDEGGHAEIGPLPETDVTVAEPAETEPTAEPGTVAEPGSESEPGAEAEPESADVAASDVPEASGDASTADEPATDDSEPAEPTEPASTTAESASETAEPEGDAADSETTETGSGPTTETAASISAGSTDESEPSSTETDSASTTAADDGDGLGDFDAGGTSTSEPDSDDDGIGDFEPSSGKTDGSEPDEPASEPADTDTAAVSGEMYEMDDEEREEIESEFGTNFSTGTEVEEPGEADIDVPDPEDLAEMEEEGAAADASNAEPATDTTPDDEPAEKSGDEAAVEETEETSDSVADEDDESDAESAEEGTPDLADVNLETVAVEAMERLDDGDGADYDAVVDAVVDEYGADASDVEDAIQDALMGGKCYEPGEGTLKAI